jgi:hypothetical protein
MNLDTNYLKSILEKELVEFQLLEKDLINQQNFLIEGDDRIDQLSEQIDIRCQKLENLKLVRTDLLTVANKTYYLEELEFILSKTEYIKIKRITAELNKLILRVKDLQLVNQMVLEQAIHFNKNRIRLMRLETDLSYAKNGAIQTEQKRSFVNRSI